MLWKRGVELLAGVTLGLCFFLVIIWLLNFVFPDATGIGLLARSDVSDETGRSLVLDGPEDRSDTIAELTEVQRSVKDRSARSVVWNRSQDGIGLEDRHAVQSQNGASATIAFDSKNHLELDENTLVVVRRPNRFAASRSTQASVLFVDGTLRGKLSGSGDASTDVEILTAGGSIRAQGDGATPAEFRLSASPTGAATLSVHGGTADVRWGDEVTRVPANHAVVFDSNGAPAAPVRLPGRPRLSGPGGDETFVYRSAPPRIDFEWSTVGAAENYRFEIARDASFEDVVYQTVTSGTSFVHGNLREGRYFWRTSALIGEAESSYSRVRRLQVVEDRQPPALELRIADGPMPRGRMTVEGTSEPGCRIVVGDDSVTADETGGFAMNLDLRDGYNVLVVQAIDPAGNTAFVTREIQARATEPGSSL